MPSASDLLDFLKLMEKMKEIERYRGQVFWRDYDVPKRYDSPADHSWRMAMILLVVEKRLSRPIDLLKALKMALIHDIPETLVGNDSPLGSDGTGNDAHTYNKGVAQQKFDKEREATNKIFSRLPAEIGEELLQLWLEYEKQETYEAKIIKALNTIEGKMQTFQWTQGRMYKKHLDFSLAYGVKNFEVDPFLQEMGELLNKELADNFTEIA